MSDLVWVLHENMGPSFGSLGVSGSYILPKNEVGSMSESLAGRRLWVILRGSEDRLLLLVKIKMVERIIDGYHTGDYWISVDTTSSIKLASSYVGAARYTTITTRSSIFGLTELSSEVSAALIVLVKNSIQTKLLRPDKRLLSTIDFQLVSINSRRLAQSALRAVVSHLTLEQIWASGAGVRMSAYANYACALIAEKTGGELASNIVDGLNAMDPLSVVFVADASATEVTKPSDNCNSPRVDTEFSEIVPEKIYAREFVSIDSKLMNLEEALNKTAHAEKIHQSMLKDISEYLLANGVTPYESSSIDLLYRSMGKLNVIEIKSSNINNILSQSSKGAFQLACYLNELSKDYEDLDARLVLHVTESRELQNYAVEALKRLGVEVLFYDPSMAWPRRVMNLPLQLSS